MRGYARSVRRVLLIVLSLNAAVALAKLVAGARANSLSVLGDGLHSVIDATNNVVGLVVVHYATRPADPDHPFGHSKFETLGAFVLSGFLFITAFELAREAMLRLFVRPATLDLSAATVATMVVTVLVNLGVSTYERNVGRRLQSDMLLADAAHTRSDVLVSGAVLVGLFASRAGYPAADAAIAVGVAGFIAYAGYRIFAEAAPILTDRVVFDPASIDRVVREVPGVESVHDIRSRGRPREAYIQMHLVVATRDVHEAHAITEEVERRLSEELGAKEILIHVEPEDDRSGPPGTRVGG